MSTKFKDPLSDILNKNVIDQNTIDQNTIDQDVIDVEPIENNISEGKEIIVYDDNLPLNIEETLDEDFELARNNIKDILETSKDVLVSAAELSLESDHPRMIEVYSGLIKNLTDINLSLIKLRENHKNIKDEQKEDSNNPINISDTDSVYIGSTESLLKAMSEMNKDQDKE